MLKSVFAIPVVLIAMGGMRQGKSPEVPQLPLSPITGKAILPSGKPASHAKAFLILPGVPSRILDESETSEGGAFQLKYEIKIEMGDPSPVLAIISDRAGIGFTFLANWKNGQEIRLKPAASLRASFVKPDGKPAEGIRIAPSYLVQKEPIEGPGEFVPGKPFPLERVVAWMSFPDSLAERLAQTTDSKGEVTFTGLPLGTSARLQVLDDRFAELSPEGASIEIKESKDNVAGPFQLKEAGIVTGTVLGDSGKPVEGVIVGAQGSGPPYGWGNSTTDKDGRFRIGKLIQGEYNVALRLEGKVEDDWTAIAHEKVEVKIGESIKNLDFRLIKGGLISGKVLDSKGIPVYGMYVGVYGPAHPRSGAWVQSSLTNKEGRYRLRVPPGQQFVYLEGGPIAGEPPSQLGQDVEVQDGKEVKVDFRYP